MGRNDDDTVEIRAKHRSGEHASPPCDIHALRIQTLEEKQKEDSGRIRAAEAQLADGRAEFTGLRKDIQAAVEAVNRLSDRVGQSISGQKPQWGQKILEGVIFWAVPVLGGGLLWVIKSSGQIPG